MSQFPREVDVLVAGGGPAGSTTAALLARAGHSVLIVDRAKFPRDKACSEYMSPAAVRVLARLGVIDALERAGATGLEGLKVTGPRGATLHGRFGSSRYPAFRDTGLAVSRRILDQELVAAARAAGSVVLERARVETLVYDRSSVHGAVVRDAAGRQHPVRARLTVGADGLRSTVARAIGDRRQKKPARIAFVAYVAGVPGMYNSAELHFGTTGYVGLNPIGANQTNVGLVVPAEQAASARGRLEEFFLDALSPFPGVRERVEAGEIVRPVLATGPFAVRSNPVIADGALLVGDAAEFFDPFTGDGIYSALRGAELAADTADAALSRPGPVTRRQLWGYRRKRFHAFAGKWLVERLIDRAARFPRFFDRAVARIGRRPDMAHAVVGVAGGYVPTRVLLNPVFLARTVL